MSNNRDELSSVSRALIAGALVGTTTSCIEQWRSYQNGEKSLNQTAAKVVSDPTKAGLVSGAVMAVASATAGRPLLTMLTVISAGAAGLYLMDAMKNKENDDESA